MYWKRGEQIEGGSIVREDLFNFKQIIRYVVGLGEKGEGRRRRGVYFEFANSFRSCIETRSSKEKETTRVEW